MIMQDYKNHKPVKPTPIGQMILASLGFILTMFLLFSVLAVWSV